LAATEFPHARTAVVTGAGGLRGIGREVARTLAAEGWALALVDRDAGGLRQVREELVAAGHTAVDIPADVTDEESVRRIYQAVDEADLPPVVGLVNLAGVPSPTPLADQSLEEWNRVMAVSATGSFLMLRGAAPRMRAAGVGRIVNTSSITAFDGGGTFSKGGYAAAKAAVLGLTRGAARELGPDGITVNAVAPGPIDTDIMGGTLTEERKAEMSAGIPAGRVGKPQEVAALIAFLLSANAGYLTGETFRIDGGKHMF